MTPTRRSGSSTMMFEPGQIIDGYALVSSCGAGAYGRVFIAENTLTRQRVALKILMGSAAVTERELKGLCRYRDFHHPNLLQIHHVGRFDEHLFYTMDLADNAARKPGVYEPDTLGNRLRHGPLPAPAVLQMALDVLEGLSCLHDNGFIHRDIKPDNIIFVSGRAMLADIGLMCESDQVSLIGTPAFMSVEVLRGTRPIAPRDDVYALGKVIYCALTGCEVREYPRMPSTMTLSHPTLVRVISRAFDEAPSMDSAVAMRNLLVPWKMTAAEEPPAPDVPLHVRLLRRVTPAMLLGAGLLIGLVVWAVWPVKTTDPSAKGEDRPRPVIKPMPDPPVPLPP